MKLQAHSLGGKRKGRHFVGTTLSSVCWLAAVLVCLLLVQPPSQIRLVECQLEAVGAVLSVVPVTSILATAGLVGVKLAAISRLLDMLGYDRAYLAQGGKGTAAHPIGLQTNYAYMFPYVPGLNISVSGDHRLGVPITRPEAAASAGPARNEPTKGGDVAILAPSPHRKTYPAMALPGDYEALQRPFRGSESLREIFQQAGLNVRLPTVQQQQQLQQQLNIPQQAGKHALIIELPQSDAANKSTTTANNFDDEQQQQRKPATNAPDASGQATGVKPQSTAARTAPIKEARLVVAPNFGMPALNIHSVRRRRRIRRSVLGHLLAPARQQRLTSK